MPRERSKCRDSPWRFLWFFLLVPVFWSVANFAIGTASPALGVPDDPRWDWVIRALGGVLAIPACWFAVGARNKSAGAFNVSMTQLYNAVSNLAYGVGVIAGIVALVMVFVSGTEWVVRFVYMPSLRIASAALFMVVPVALFACLFRRARLASCSAMVLSSVVCGFALWAYSLYVAATISKVWMVVGVLIGGLGVIPVALVASCLTAAWPAAGSIAVGSVIVLALRLGGLFGMHAAASRLILDEPADDALAASGDRPQRDP
jgi:hypothetical protein